MNPRDLMAGGSERDRTVDLAIFSRSLYQLSYRAMNSRKDPDGTGPDHSKRLRPDLNR